MTWRDPIHNDIPVLATDTQRTALAYATWLPELATDEPDGLPDRGMVPLVESLRSAGFTTYQSCYGHDGQGDGCLWIAEAPQFKYDFGPFSRIQVVLHGPEGRAWEWWWEFPNAEAALSILATAYLPHRKVGRTS